MNRFLECWESIERKSPRPERSRFIMHREYSHWKNEIQKQDWEFVINTVHSLYQGDIYILRNAFSKDFMLETRNRVMDYFHSKPSEFHKMLEGTPDFHRLIAPETGKKYSFKVCKHSAFFYPWADPLNLFPPVYEKWRVIKTLMGLKSDEYERNTPKDGVVDRIQIAQYPSKIGYLEPHSDPYLHQRLFFSGYMGERGVDYQGGGFYVVGENNQVINCEDQITTGDIGIGYATIYHGVSPCNRDKEPNWDSVEGRWFLSMYSNASDEVKDRHTGTPVKLDLPGVLP